MITGMHAVLFTTDADADRALFRDVLSSRRWTPAAVG